MKMMLLLLLCGMTFCLPFKNKPDTSDMTSNSSKPEFISSVASISASSADTISFSAQIEPILKTRCSPCHFPGGKMYEKLPFDQPKTIIDHQEVILKRIKDENESALFRQFLAANTKKQYTTHP